MSRGGPVGGGAVRARIVITGRVQGVAYRQSAVDEARRLGLRGWVKNRHDGSVEALAEGEHARVEALIGWCRHGPRLARVDDVRVAWEPAAGDLAPFDIAF